MKTEFNKKLFVHKFETKWGEFRTAATESKLVLISMPAESISYFDDKIAERLGGLIVEQGGKLNKQAEKEIKAYLAGNLKKFTIDFEINASPFQKKVLKFVSKIPYGKIFSYGEIALKLGNPRASRAVGTANARNNLPLIIPCHRVVAANGPGGYGGGLPLKIKLLRHEGVQI
ncbi:MAG: MGMT family protein [candidate division Zixibacteria bacterium]